MANQDALEKALECLKLEALLSLIPGADDKHTEDLKEFCRILVYNGCPTDALLKGLKALGDITEDKHEP